MRNTRLPMWRRNTACTRGCWPNGSHCSTESRSIRRTTTRSRSAKPPRANFPAPNWRKRQRRSKTRSSRKRSATRPKLPDLLRRTHSLARLSFTFGGRPAARDRRRRARHALAEPRRLLRRRHPTGSEELTHQNYREDRRSHKVSSPVRRPVDPRSPAHRAPGGHAVHRLPARRHGRYRRAYRGVGRRRHRPARAGRDDGIPPSGRSRSSGRTASRATCCPWRCRRASRPSASRGVRAAHRCAATATEDATSKAIDGISSDPKITSLKIGGPGSGGSPRFHGDIAELRVYNRPLTESECKQVEGELAERVVPT